jgi:hypothetical protein
MRLLIMWLVSNFNRLVCLPDGDTSPGRTASAFALEPLLEASVMVCLASYFLSREKLCPVSLGGNGGKIALADIHANDVLLAGGLRVRCFNGQTHQQIETLPGAIIPEVRSANDGSLVNHGHMLVGALVGGVDASSKREDAHRVSGPERVVMPIDIGERRLNLYRSRHNTTRRTISVGYSRKLNAVLVRSLKVCLHAEQRNVQ